MKIETLKYKHKNKWEVNGVEVKFHWSHKNNSLLYEVLSKLNKAVFEQDHKTVSSLLIKYKNKNLVNLLNFLEEFCLKEYTDFIISICNEFLVNRQPFNEITVFNTLVYSSSLSELEMKKRSYDSLSKTKIKKIVYSCIEKRLISNIKVALTSFNKKLFWETSPCLERPYLFKILQNELREDFELFVRNCAKEFTSIIKSTGYQRFISYCLIGEEDAYFAARIERYISKFPIFKTVIKEIVTNFSLNKKDEYKFDDDEWTVVEGRNIESIRMAKLVFTSLNDNLKKEVKQYINALLDTSTSRKKIQGVLSSVKLILNELENLSYELRSLSNINFYHVQHLVIHFQNLKRADGKRKYTLSTIRAKFTHMRLIIDWFIDKNESLQMNNPFRKYKFVNAHSFTEYPTEYIPDEIVKQLQDTLCDAPKNIQNILIIMLNTGLRISDAINLDVDCLQYNKRNEAYELSYQPAKTEQIRERRGLPEYHKIVVNDAVVDAISNQIDNSLDLRLLSGSTKIFLSNRYNIITQPNPSTISTHINKVIKKHNIKDADNKLFYFKNHMCRKTLIVELLTKGESVESIADYVAHLSTETTRRYYAELEKGKLAELDNAMFEKLFDETLDAEIKKQYTFNERNSLIKEIKLGVRETPEGHGYCTKHISFGPCQKKSCVGCKMLITGPQKLPMWHKLYNEQKQYLNELAAEYQKNNVSDYKEHRLYQQQQRLLTIYKDTIEQVEKFALKEGIQIEAKIDNSI
ncbi:site-specific tyrosine recombinase XerC [Bacillus paranthracis]|uniref:tyrosine-type recombinase/integrase n=1 Tax=Bacillus cereus group TaxID=86661 RepID=UPI000A302023|nr:site-specific integrase [Bacillus paranthracis]MCR6791549.1 site-specific integrase [Bacillus paranthracis]MED1169544.1 site-specific integrase [Bacillus paranthracis]SME26467.1 site-specific tyrosine recombinase XerC [Bacillus paranthracis]